MSEILKPLIKEVLPSKEEIVIFQGAKSINNIPPTSIDSLNSAMVLLKENAFPLAIIKESSKSEFDEIYFGEGNNADDGILPNIVKNAEKLFLFAATIGEAVTSEINKHFDQKEFPIGSFLDSGASLATDNIADFLEMKLQDKTTFSYSPGYCGWHISGQKKLFQFLEPDKIGITLNDSYLMTPLKSISGVLVSGPSEIHIFKNNFSFCSDCKTYSCKNRMKSIINA